jgi:transcriptional regulator with XRE-family HTH domain
MMTGHHTRWERPEEPAEDPERIAIREALAFGKALYDTRTVLGLTVTDLAARAGMAEDEIECIEECGTEPTVALLCRLAAALDPDVRLTGLWSFSVCETEGGGGPGCLSSPKSVAARPPDRSGAAWHIDAVFRPGGTGPLRQADGLRGIAIGLAAGRSIAAGQAVNVSELGFPLG